MTSAGTTGGGLIYAGVLALVVSALSFYLAVTTAGIPGNFWSFILIGLAMACIRIYFTTILLEKGIHVINVLCFSWIKF